MFKKIVLPIVLLILLFWMYTARVSRPQYTSLRSDLLPLPALAGKEQALTFARTASSLLLVTGIQSGTVRAVDLTSVYGEGVWSDPVGLYHKVGYDSLAALTGPERTVDIKNLQLPLDFGVSHLAAGTNYAEHAEEVSLKDPPFLFPKIVAPTLWNSPVNFTKRLDYEGELALIPLADMQSPDSIPAFGLIAVNDFTDRWTLIKGLKLRQPMGTTGFAASKGQPTFLPTGYLLVIPRDRDFYKKVEIRVFVNDRMRQRFSTEDMILGIEDIVKQAFTDREAIYRNGNSTVNLIPDEGIERGCMILTGTAGGVIFKPVNFWWQGPYLKAGDVVRTEASFLGHLENKIQQSIK